MQSVSKVVAYAYLLTLYLQSGRTEKDLHKYVGDEPSGQPFNIPVFDKHGRPHNPMVNAGAILVCTLLIDEGKHIEDFQEFYKQCSSAPRADIDLPLYKEEALTGTTNHALRSLMLSKKCYPQKATFAETKVLADQGLDWYFVQCSMLVDAEGVARFGAMLANNGVNPNTGERMLHPIAVKATVTLMLTCGMYDGSGRFAKAHGVPSKSGVSGCLLSVLPGIGAFATFSPPLDNEGNCVRGVALIDKMSAVYGNINIFHKDGIKLDVTRRPYQTLIQTVIASCKAAATGDLETLNRLQASGVNLGERNSQNNLVILLRTKLMKVTATTTSGALCILQRPPTTSQLLSSWSNARLMSTAKIAGNPLPSTKRTTTKSSTSSNPWVRGGRAPAPWRS